MEIHLDLRLQQFRLPGYAYGGEIGGGKEPHKLQPTRSRSWLPISEDSKWRCMATPSMSITMTTHRHWAMLWSAVVTFSRKFATEYRTKLSKAERRTTQKKSDIILANKRCHELLLQQTGQLQLFCHKRSPTSGKDIANTSPQCRKCSSTVLLKFHEPLTFFWKITNTLCSNNSSVSPMLQPLF